MFLPREQTAGFFSERRVRFNDRGAEITAKDISELNKLSAGKKIDSIGVL